MYRRIVPCERMVKQELDMSCGPACARQWLLDNGIDVPEPQIRELARCDPAMGVDDRDLKQALEKLDSRAEYKSGSVDPEYLDALLRIAPFIARIRQGKTKHFIIVDALEGDLLRVRDPAGVAGDDSGHGAEGWVERRKFVDVWTSAFNSAIYRKPK